MYTVKLRLSELELFIRPFIRTLSNFFLLRVEHRLYFFIKGLKTKNKNENFRKVIKSEIK